MEMRMDKPRILDLFSGAGGAAKGYQRAGFYVVGVDINPQPHYCGDEFHQADALTYPLEGFDAYHASPPCQDRTRACMQWRKEGRVYPQLIPQIRERLVNTRKPYIIENVPDAATLLINPTLLCGSMFNLRTYRHRLFETSFEMPLILDYGHGLKQDPMAGPKDKRMQPMLVIVGHCGYSGEGELRKKAMDIDWMSQTELTQAIPPAYTEYIGKYLMQEVLRLSPINNTAMR